MISSAGVFSLYLQFEHTLLFVLPQFQTERHLKHSCYQQTIYTQPAQPINCSNPITVPIRPQSAPENIPELSFLNGRSLVGKSLTVTKHSLNFMFLTETCLDENRAAVLIKSAHPNFSFMGEWDSLAQPITALNPMCRIQTMGKYKSEWRAMMWSSPRVHSWSSSILHLCSY